MVNRRAAMLAAARNYPAVNTLPCQGEWIPVSERMPEKGQAVLVYRPKAHEGGDSDVRVAAYGRHNFEHGFCYWGAVALDAAASRPAGGETIKNANALFVINKSQVCIYANDNREEARFTELYQTGVLTRIAAVKVLMVAAGDYSDCGGKGYSCVCGRLLAEDSRVVWPWTTFANFCELQHWVCGRYTTRSPKIPSITPSRGFYRICSFCFLSPGRGDNYRSA